MMKNIFYTATLAALAAGYVSAECNNMCSGHGICEENDSCTCYRNWRGNDCSERTCQYGVAFVVTAQGDLNHDGIINAATLVNTQWSPFTSETAVGGVYPGGTFEEYFIGSVTGEEAHTYMECSNKGICDRASGECVCFDGYEGSSCQRTVCPNSCSGHGICRNIQDVSKNIGQGSLKDPLLTYSAATDYLLWDALKNQACVCDPGYKGYDCSLRECPKGHDPLDDFKENQIQTVTVTIEAAKTFRLLYTDLFGEVWTTDEISSALDHDATEDEGIAEVTAALTGIPNSVIEGVGVTVASDGTNQVYTIEFTHNAGILNKLSYTDTDVVIAVTIESGDEATTVAQECSGRGLCDYDTGLCKCFRGYKNDDCSSQSALAFMASA